MEIKFETTQTLDAMLHQILNQALVSIDASAGSLMLVDTKQNILQIKARLGKPRHGRDAEVVFKLDDASIASWVAREKKYYVCNDVSRDPNFRESRSGKNFSSLLSVPILHNNRVIGVINADADQSDFFTDAHVSRLESIAAQVAPTVAERMTIFAAVSEIGFELAQLPRAEGVGPVLDKIVQVAVRTLGADLVTLYQYQNDEFLVEGKGPTYAGKINIKNYMVRKVYPGDVPWTVVHQRQSGFYSDVSHFDFLAGEIERPSEAKRPRFIVREGIKSMAALLLPYSAGDNEGEEVVGAMFANYRTPHDFNIDERNALVTFADFAAIAIQNARHEEQRRLKQSQVISIISTFPASFAHRMGNLASASRTAAQILRPRITDPDEFVERQLTRIEDESKALFELADRLVDQFRHSLDTTQLSQTDLRQVLTEACTYFDSELLTIRVDLPPAVPKVQSVDFQLLQVLRDLIKNAAEATEHQDVREIRIRGHVNKADNVVELEISDNGPGIPEEKREKLFSLIRTLPGKLGIGLWYCSVFMKATGGDVILKDPQPESGASFVLKIPYLGEDDRDILIVDDDEVWQGLVKDALSLTPYAIEVVSSYEQAIEMLSTYRFKVAVLDSHLVEPQEQETTEGMRILQYLERRKLDVRVIFLTGYDEQEIQSPNLIRLLYKTKFNLAEFSALVERAVTGDQQ